MKIFISTMALVLASAAPAMAQTNSGTTSSSSTMSGSNGTNSSQAASPQIMAKVKQDLTQAGFTDVNVMPAELVVHATNKDGDPVLMFIGPQSLSEFVGSLQTRPVPRKTLVLNLSSQFILNNQILDRIAFLLCGRERFNKQIICQSI